VTDTRTDSSDGAAPAAPSQASIPAAGQHAAGNGTDNDGNGTPSDARTIHLLRRALLAFGALGVIGTAVELAMLRHWKTGTQMIPWFILGLVVIAIALVAVRPTRIAVRAAQLLTVVITLGGLFGMKEHVEANFNAGPLDRVYGPKWDSMSTMSQWWKAFTHTVGPSPTLAPGVLIQAALCVALATLHHPALARRPS
jgi:hypothetical protein